MEKDRNKRTLSEEMYSKISSLPIFDYHNHLSAQALYENKAFERVSDLWIGADHYKWRAMRGAGVDEALITGGACDKERFGAWYKTMLKLVGSPLYKWSVMELERVFGVDIPITQKNEERVFEICLKALAGGIRPWDVLLSFGVETLCTVNDPFESLEFHGRLLEDGGEMSVLPIFRPDKLLAIEKPGWLDAVKRLSESENVSIDSLNELEAALEKSLQRFAALGCVTADHGMDEFDFDAGYSVGDAELAAGLALSEEAITKKQALAFSSYLLELLARDYSRRSWVMQLHFGALRDVNSRLFRRLGHDAGGDCVGNALDIKKLAVFLDRLDSDDKLPKTIIFPINSKDWNGVAALAPGFFQSGVAGKIQLGAAWWFNDHERGIKGVFDEIAEQSALHGFVGMLTDSRSVSSFVRHEYFRRILCDYLAEKFISDSMDDLEVLEEMAANICYFNAKNFFAG